MVKGERLTGQQSVYAGKRPCCLPLVGRWVGAVDVCTKLDQTFIFCCSVVCIALISGSARGWGVNWR